MQALTDSQQIGIRVNLYDYELYIIQKHIDYKQCASSLIDPQAYYRYYT